MSKKLLIFTPIFLSLLLIYSSVVPLIQMSEDISQKVFRLHIIANSDTTDDQNLKLKVRDGILKESEKLFENCNSVDEAIIVSRENTLSFLKTAQSIINENGYDYNVSVKVDNEYFSTRHYDDFTLPAGEYDCLKIIIGEGKGHNWWCVMFPAVCVSGCSDEFEKTLSDDEINMIKDNKFIIRFKTVELYEKIKSIC